MQKITGIYSHEEPGDRTNDNQAATIMSKKFISSSTGIEQIEIFDHLPDIRQLRKSQYLIALRTSASGDVHFMRSDWKNGRLVWTHKPGDGGPLLELVGIDPDDDRAWRPFAIEIIPGNTEDFQLVATDNNAYYTGQTYYLKVTLPGSSCNIV